MGLKANDLRIGNKVYLNEVVITIAEIWSDCVFQEGFKSRSAFDMISYQDIKGIPLSCEILEKCGKKCDSNNQWEYEINVGALKWYFRWNTEWYSEIGNIYIGANVQYLHQLQNLYFAFLRNELTVNL